MNPRILVYLADAALPVVGIVSFIRHFKGRTVLEDACLDMVNVGLPLYLLAIAAMWMI